MRNPVWVASSILVASLGFSQDNNDAGRDMMEGARELFRSLAPEKQDQVLIAFDDVERYNFHYIPRERKGVSLKVMTPGERKLAEALFATGLSASGMSKLFRIMYLDQILYEIERRDIRDPDRYFVTIFGDPSANDDWGWRVEGHHLSLNYTLRDGEVASTSPSFLGTNPAIVREGPHAGMQVLRDEELRGRELLLALDATQRRRAMLDMDAPADILSTTDRRAKLGEPTGLAYRDMSAAQQKMLMALVEDYAHRHRRELAEQQLVRIRNAGVNDMHFAWAGGSNPGDPHYYRIHGPTFLIEYDNTQNDANHVHTVWRDLEKDWGEETPASDADDDLLARHYRESSHHHSGLSRDQH
jgi:hypothetical protein